MEKRIIVNSLIYKFTERIAVKAIGLIISIIMARMLMPEDFGTIAIIMIFINISQIMIQGGFSSALIQKKETTEDDYTTVCIIYIILSLVLVAILHIIAPIIGDFYSNDNIALPLKVYSWSLVVGAFNSVQLARLQKKMNFKVIMLCNLLATLVSGAIGIVCAYMGVGLWALILYYFLNVVCAMIIILIIERWIPKGKFSRVSAESLFSFGWKMLVSSCICSLYKDLRILIIGKMFSTADLGYYNRGQQFPEIISQTLDNSIQSVMFPAISSVQENTLKVKTLLRKNIVLGSYIIFPVMVGLCLVSNELISILLTEKWMPCVIFMQLICIAEAKLPLTSANLIVLKSLGHSDIYMKLEIIRRMIMLAILGMSLFYKSMIAIAVGYVISAWIDVIVVSIPMKKLLNYGFINQFKDTFINYVTTLAMAITVVFVKSLIRSTCIVELTVSVIVGIFVYVVISIITKNQAFNELLLFF